MAGPARGAAWHRIATLLALAAGAVSNGHTASPNTPAAPAAPAAPPPPAAPDARAVPAPGAIRFSSGQGRAVLKAAVHGDRAPEYLVTAGAGQTLTVVLDSRHGGLQANLWAPGAQEAMGVVLSDGAALTRVLPVDGAYRLQPYLMRSAARRHERGAYTLTVTLSGQALPPLPHAQDARVAGTPFHATAEVRCQLAYQPALRTCQAGVVRRGRDGTATVEWRAANGTAQQALRRVLFVRGQPVASDSALPLRSSRDGDTTHLDLDGVERYDAPDALLTGG